MRQKKEQMYSITVSEGFNCWVRGGLGKEDG